MPYATQSDLDLRLAPELRIVLADDNSDGVADAEIITAALNDATAEIDHALAKRYVVPITSAPEAMKHWCVDLAISRLFRRRREALPKEHAESAALARKALKAIRNGATGLAGATPLLDSFETENTRREEQPAFDGKELKLF